MGLQANDARAALSLSMPPDLNFLTACLTLTVFTQRHACLIDRSCATKSLVRKQLTQREVLRNIKLFCVERSGSYLLEPLDAVRCIIHNYKSRLPV